MKSYQLRRALTEDERAPLAAYEPLIQQLLFHRGITTKDAAEDFFDLDYAKLHDPFLIPDMKAAVVRIKQAIEQKEKIMIYADYDADGIPGAVVLSDFFKMIDYDNVDVYIPHRNKEGFGLNVQALDQIKESGTDLIVTIDCGTADVEEIAYAKSLGMDVIVTDHHKNNDVMPEALIVNPKRSDSTYPEQVLCGSGVAFKLVQALLSDDTFAIAEGKEKWLLDMVGIATLSDMVPLTGENRILAHYGMFVLRKSPRKGLLHLFKKAGTQQDRITETDIGFTISPRINAASRMGKPLDAFHLLASTTDDEAALHIQKLEKLNSERKGHVAACVKHAREKIATAKQDTSKVVVVGDVKWQPSLLGLVANALAEEHACPVFVWGRGDGKELKGSCRTGNALSLHELLSAHQELFDAYGGHDEAGGFVIKSHAVDTFHPALHDFIATTYDEVPTKSHYIDAVIGSRDLSLQLYDALQKLGPFGVGNHEPLLKIENLEVVSIEVFGKQDNHTKIKCKTAYGPIEAIAFFLLPDALTKTPSAGETVSIVGTLELNTWGRRKQLRIRLHDCH